MQKEITIGHLVLSLNEASNRPYEVRMDGRLVSTHTTIADALATVRVTNAVLDNDQEELDSYTEEEIDEVEEAVKQEAVKQDGKEEILNAYQAVKAETRNETVRIAEIVKRSGRTVDEVNEVLTSLCQAGQAVPFCGEPVFASAQEKASALQVFGESFLLVKIYNQDISLDQVPFDAVWDGETLIA